MLESHPDRISLLFAAKFVYRRKVYIFTKGY